MADWSWTGADAKVPDDSTVVQAHCPVLRGPNRDGGWGGCWWGCSAGLFSGVKAFITL